ncbi:MAG: sugar phosphate nucleotidyltransferase [Candidatus Eisenbacteria bacterium]
MPEAISALILAGGQGERLATLTDRPKPLIEIGGRPFLGYLLDALAGAGVRRVVLLTGYRAALFPDRLAEELARHAGLEVLFLEEGTPLGTAGALKRALPHVGTRALVLNGDSYCALDLPDFLRFHAAHPDALSLAAVRMPDAGDYGRLLIDGDGRLVGFDEKSAGGEAWINAGLYGLPRRFFEALPDRPASLEREVLPAWVAREPGWVYRSSAYFCDIGTPERLDRACRELPRLLAASDAAGGSGEARDRPGRQRRAR